MDQALRIIISNSAHAAREAIGCLRAIQVGSPMVQQRYNRVVELAFSDPDATFTAAERRIIADSISAGESNSRDFMLRIRLTEAERIELIRISDGANTSMSEYVRQRIFS